MALSPEDLKLIEGATGRPWLTARSLLLGEANIGGILNAARAQGRQQATTSTGEPRPLSPANTAAVEAVFGHPVMLDEEGDDWNALLDYVRAQGRASLEERVWVLEEGLRGLLEQIRDPKHGVVLECMAPRTPLVDLLNTESGEAAVRTASALLATPGERENG